MRYRIFYHSYADVEADSPEEAVNIDATEQIMKHLMVGQIRDYRTDEIL